MINTPCFIPTCIYQGSTWVAVVNNRKLQVPAEVRLKVTPAQLELDS